MAPSRLGRSRLFALLVFLALACATGKGAAPPPPLHPAAVRLQEEALALAARDDSASLERALGLLEQASGLQPGLYQARADRALVELLVAACRREEAARLASGDALMQSGRELRERALDELRPLVREHAGAPAVVRALAVYYGLEGNAVQTARLVDRARAARASDPWIDFAEEAAAVRNASPETAALRLAAFAASHPEVLRARVMLARAQLDLSRTDDALLTLDEILAANPSHDLAQALKAHTLSPPPASVTVVPPVPQAGPTPRPTGYLPHKPSSSRGDAARGDPASP
jgi:tetratricopeptide (TPR) repeat protein